MTRSSYSRSKVDGNGTVVEVHSFNLRTTQLVLSIITAVMTIAVSTTGLAWWMIGPRLDSHIDERSHAIIAPKAVEAEREHGRIRAEALAAIAAEREARKVESDVSKERLIRIETDLVYIRTRIDQLYARGR